MTTFFVGISVHMEDVGNKDDISTYEDDFFVCNRAEIMTTFLDFKVVRY